MPPGSPTASRSTPPPARGGRLPVVARQCPNMLRRERTLDAHVGPARHVDHGVHDRRRPHPPARHPRDPDRLAAPDLRPRRDRLRDHQPVRPPTRKPSALVVSQWRWSPMSGGQAHARTEWRGIGQQRHLSTAVRGQNRGQRSTRPAPLVYDHRLRTQLDEVRVAEGAGHRVEVRFEQASSAAFVMLPVATISSRRGDPDSRCPSRKSRSLVTTTRPSPSATSAIRASVVRLPSGNSDVCTTSWPASARNRASRAGS